MTLAELVDTLTARFASSALFYGHGTDNPADEAYWLAVRGSGIDFEQAPEKWHQRLEPGQVERCLEIAGQRIDTRQPLAYLLGEAWFADLPFFVDRRVLVPRSHFGPLIGNRLKPWVDLDRVSSILDLCTGSGCIGIALALRCPGAEVTLADISADALEVAAVNVRRHRLESRLRLHRGDLFEGLDGRRFDLIVSNPPYVHPDRRSTMPDEYGFEPEIGLYSEQAGLRCPLAIVRNAGEYLGAGGTLLVEFASAAGAFADRFETGGFEWADDRFGDPVIAVAGKETLERFARRL